MVIFILYLISLAYLFFVLIEYVKNQPTYKNIQRFSKDELFDKDVFQINYNIMADLDREKQVEKILELRKERDELSESDIDERVELELKINMLELQLKEYDKANKS